MKGNVSLNVSIKANWPVRAAYLWAAASRGSGLGESIPGSTNNFRCDFEQVISVLCALVSLSLKRGEYSLPEH